ncbi:hypothetical protein IW261DRAFT_1428184 [Armillaria novae-zelandiae]|uniref:Uncharacterized protein n=1 Tax=Armillaria novae-zelandiae TaxID=153914 RepID=A0AA39NAV7_9AGAR|nr:hypothetical protein IW261DRAFT_1428184 [Armillaria novae-zelandiae]
MATAYGTKSITTISFLCRKPNTTVAIMMRQIMRVTSPGHMTELYAGSPTEEVLKKKTNKIKNQKLKNVPVEWVIDQATMGRQQGMVVIWVDGDPSVECGMVIHLFAFMAPKIGHIPNEDGICFSRVTVNVLYPSRVTNEEAHVSKKMLYSVQFALQVSVWMYHSTTMLYFRVNWGGGNCSWLKQSLIGAHSVRKFAPSARCSLWWRNANGDFIIGNLKVEGTKRLSMKCTAFIHPMFPTVHTVKDRAIPASLGNGIGTKIEKVQE